MNDRHGRRTRHRVLLLAAAALLTLALVPAGAHAGTANAGLHGATSDPIAGLTWGIYKGGDDNIYPTYQKAKGEKKTLLAELALRPEAYWFGQTWKYPEADIRKYIKFTTGGNSSVMAQFTDFSVAPWEASACNKVPTAKQLKAYKRWNSAVAAGIGSSRVLVVLQPDLPVANAKCVPAKAKKLDLADVAWTAKKLSGHKHTTVYIDAGASDWTKAGQAAQLLMKAGIRHARGFALGATHFTSTDTEILYGQKIVRYLNGHGVKGKHFIIDTAENGHPFTHQAYTKATGSGAHWASRPACKPVKHKARFCQTFGIPPTWQTGAGEWHLGARDSAIAKQLVDGYVWFGRPWMKGQVYPFEPGLTEEMARSTPFPYPKYGEPTASASAASMLTWPSNL